MVGANTNTFFEAQQDVPGNGVCCDTGAITPLWASVSHGIYISIEAAGVHRSLGVSTSFVLSLTLDHWKPSHLRLMELGGNQRFQAFMSDHGVPENLPIREKYSTRAAAWYRAHLHALAEGTVPPEPLPHGTGHLPFLSHPDPTLAVLDRVFASVQSGRNLTEEAILAAFAMQSRAEALKNKERCPTLNVSKWMCEQLQSLLEQLFQLSDVERESLQLQDQLQDVPHGRDAEENPWPIIETDRHDLEAAEQQQQALEVR